jgi:hypothetical protein
LKVLTYERTHTGDPDLTGTFGINDCMGQIREYEFDTVIGVGGIGQEPISYGIDRKINWVGIKARKKQVAPGYPAVVNFEHFVLLEDKGPLLSSLAPSLAKRLHKSGARFILDSYTEIEKAEADKILNWTLNTKLKPAAFGPVASVYITVQ